MDHDLTLYATANLTTLFIIIYIHNGRRNLYSPDAPIKWREATRYTVQECDEVAMECAMAECVEDGNGNWECEGGLGPNVDGSERPYKTQQVIMQHS